MKIEDLRIGNYLQLKELNHVNEYGFKYSKVTTIYADRCVLDNHYPQQWFKPIELTEEILLKCGFVNDTGNYLQLNFSESCNLYFDLEHKTIAIGVPYEAGATEFMYEYLHQLQNLYFALTGEELKITL